MFKFIYMCNYLSGQRKRDPEFPTICVLIQCVLFKAVRGKPQSILLGKEDMYEI